jgi:hypothetical protein
LGRITLPADIAIDADVLKVGMREHLVANQNSQNEMQLVMRLGVPHSVDSKSRDNWAECKKLLRR